MNAYGLGASSYNVGGSGAAFGVANNTTLNVYQLLLAANAKVVKGVLYGGNATLNAQDPRIPAIFVLGANCLLAQATQYAACNLPHTAEQRLARLPLMTQDRVGADWFGVRRGFHLRRDRALQYGPAACQNQAGSRKATGRIRASAA